MGILLDANKYEWFIKNLCGRAGLTEEAAEITAKVLVGNDKMGILTHGTYHLDSYIKKFAAGGIDPQAVPEVVAEGPAWALMDAHHAMGSVAGWKAMEKAIYKAGTAGVDYVGIKDSSHFGSCAYYSIMAAD
jgi:LDH2 family malate/lactate/ureidoglycolate dehydrogenase